MVRVNDAPSFKFGSTTGNLTLLDLFAGRKQLILYHFMLGPDNKEGCVGCSLFADHIPDLRHLASANTSFACIATAPVEKIEAFKKHMGWKFPFHSSHVQKCAGRGSCDLAAWKRVFRDERISERG